MINYVILHDYSNTRLISYEMVIFFLDKRGHWKKNVDFVECMIDIATIFSFVSLLSGTFFFDR